MLRLSLLSYLHVLSVQVIFVLLLPLCLLLVPVQLQERQLQERMSGDFDYDSSEAFAEIGSRLLSLTLTRSRNTGKQYASDPAQADHGISLLNEGARLNLKWNF